MTAPATISSGFERLSPAVQRWVYDQNWPSLRDTQEAAIPLLLDGTRDVLISAPTAGGKTEAAFLPIVSALETSPGGAAGVQVLYVAPLKALINDQYERLLGLCEHTDIGVHRWHGDVNHARTRKVLDRPDGILLLTPESLEAMFVLRGSRLPALFGGLRYIVIDELHAFLGTERGAQLTSLLHRLDVAAGHRIARVGLSATLGDMFLAARQVRPADPAGVALVVSKDGGRDLLVGVRGYLRRPPPSPRRTAAVEADPGGDGAAHVAAAVRESDRTTTPVDGRITDHLFRVLRGTDNLVFANSRGAVEKYADLLRQRCEQAGLPNEFVVHHGNLSKSRREAVESALKDPARPTTAVATTTLEMGIDIGSVTAIGQIGPPPSVASLRQRLGRSGRRGSPGILRAYLSETQLDPRNSLDDELRNDLVQTIAMIELLREGWCEPPSPAVLHTSTLVQQLLSLIAQRGGVTPTQAHQELCGPDGPFSGTGRRRFARLLQDLGQAAVLQEDADGTLLLGAVGEVTVNHYTFFSAFKTPEEYRLFSGGHLLGTLPISHLLRAGLPLTFAGQRWRVLDVDDRHRTIDLARSAAGAPPTFFGAGLPVHDVVRARMRTVLRTANVLAYLDAEATDLLAEARQNFRRRVLDQHCVQSDGSGTLITPWAGTTTSHTLALELTLRGANVAVDGLALTSASAPRQILVALRGMVRDGPTEPQKLTAVAKGKEENKYDPWLSQDLLDQDYAASRLDTVASHKLARRLLDGNDSDRGALLE